MKDAIVAAPVDTQVEPPVEAPFEALVDEKAVAQDLHNKLYDGEEYDDKAETTEQ